MESRMPTPTKLLVALLVLPLAASCGRSEERSLPHASGAAPSAATGAQAALDHLDTRAPVPLLPMMANHQKQNMRDHLVAVQEIVAGASAGDFAAIERAAGRIGFSEQMGRMCTHMGAGAPGFTEQALKFHHTADTIGDAARRKDSQAVWTALGETLQTCTGCHAVWKQSIVDEETWTRLTTAPGPTGHTLRPDSQPAGG
jgi:hypothetical protein